MPRRDAYIEYLSSVPLFAACGPKDLKFIARATTDIDASEGDVLVREGRPGHEFFVILDGKARVERAGKRLATLGKGDFFGELALLDKAPRNATIVAEGPLQLVVLGRREFSGLLDDAPHLAHHLLTGLARRLHEVEKKKV